MQHSRLVPQTSVDEERNRLKDRISIQDRTGPEARVGGINLPTSFTIESFVEPTLRVRVAVRVVDGHARARSVQVEAVKRVPRSVSLHGLQGQEIVHQPIDREVSAAVLRRVPVAELVTDALRLFGLYMMSREQFDSALTGGDTGEVHEDMDNRHATWVNTQVGRQRRTARTDSAVREVAAVYREAMGRDAPPSAAVAQHLRCSPRTAREWVKEARDRGFLPPTTRGKAKA